MGVVGEAEEYGDRLFRQDEPSGIFGLGHPLLLWTGSGRPQFYLSKTAVLVQDAPDSEEGDRQ